MFERLEDRLVLSCSLDVTSTSDSGPGSLREAILCANGQAGTDIVTFSLPASETTIKPLTGLPAITDPIVIDGYSQPSSIPNTATDGSSDAVLLVELDGSELMPGPNTDGLFITAGNSTVRGLVINRFPGNAISMAIKGNNRIEGNFLGTTRDGEQPAGNGFYGVAIGSFGSGNVIGGTSLEACNVLSANLGGVFIADSSTSSNVIQGNLIGTDKTGTVDLGNTLDGVLINDSPGNRVGGPSPAGRNIISGSGRHGVVIAGSGATGNLVRGNSIYSNTGLGIDLGGDGVVNTNDPWDGDSGSNGLQNFPVLAAATVSAGSAKISGSLSSTASSNFTLEFFSNSMADPTGLGEGARPLGTTQVTTDASGNATFTVTPSASVAAAEWITATATELSNNNTSEFSIAIQAEDPTNSALIDFHGSDLSGKDGPLVKIDFDLTLLFHEYRVHQHHMDGAQFEPSNSRLALRSDQVGIYATADSDLRSMQEDLVALGMTEAAVFRQTVEGFVDITALDALAALESVLFAKPIYSPITNTGIALSQGDRAMHADDARSWFGVPNGGDLSGKGVTVGVLSDSFDANPNTFKSAAVDVAKGDLPGIGNSAYPSNVNVIADAPTGSNEGRAMLQIVHDVAPGASLAFATARDSAPNSTSWVGQITFANNIKMLKQAGSSVIVDDLLYIEEPMFQDGIVAQAVDTVVSSGVAYFSAAGNIARQSYESMFYDSGHFISLSNGVSGVLHDFDSSTGTKTLQQITVDGYISLQWDQPFKSVSPSSLGARTDLDMCFFKGPAPTQANLIGCKFDTNKGGDPVETADKSVTGTGSVYLAIVKRDTNVPNPLMKYVLFGKGKIAEFATNSPTIYGHANAAGAEAVGAAFYGDTPAFNAALTTAKLENFSSYGGVPILFDSDLQGTPLPRPPVTQVRLKPGIVAPDGGNTSFFGVEITNDADMDPNFFGTSAAAPHAAALAALMIEKGPCPGGPPLTPTEIYRKLRGSALDMDDPATMGIFDIGPDYATGYGLISAQRALNCGEFVAGSILGVKFEDKNGNGVRDLPEDVGLPGWTIKRSGGGAGPVEQITAADGTYSFTDLKPGTYTITEVLQPGWTQTTASPGPIVLASGQQKTGEYFGNFENIKICGMKFEDLNANGAKDPDEPGLAGWSIFIDADNDSVFDVGEMNTVTDAFGNYCLTDLGPGTYTVREDPQAGWTASNGGDEYTITAAESGVDPKSGHCNGRLDYDDAAYDEFTGQVAVATCFVPNLKSGDAVLGIVDVKHQTRAPLNQNYAPPMYHGPANDEWTKAKLGDIFGLTLDDVGNIYVTATTSYFDDAFSGLDTFGPGGSGAVYRVDKGTGIITTFAMLPNTGKTGLGNITYDTVNDVFYVSNMEDGRIYEIKSVVNQQTGQIVGEVRGTFDHATELITNNGAAEVGDTAGFPPLGERVWGVQVHGERLYYGVWWEDFGRRKAGQANEVWSVALGPVAGSAYHFVVDTMKNPKKQEFTVPARPGNYSNPVSDISFGPNGTMLLAERGMLGDSKPFAHESRALEYSLDVTTKTWIPTTTNFEIGNTFTPGADSAGGVDYDYGAGGRVWVSMDEVIMPRLSPIYTHNSQGLQRAGLISGLQGLPASGGNVDNSILIDLDGDVSRGNKNQIGDVEIPCPAKGFDFGNFRLGSIHGIKFWDKDKDGMKGIGEEGLFGWTITLSGTDFMGVPVVSQTMMTIPDSPISTVPPGPKVGTYAFTDLKPGTYTVCETAQTDWVNSLPGGNGCWTLTVKSGDELVADFGNHLKPGIDAFADLFVEDTPWPKGYGGPPDTGLEPDPIAPIADMWQSKGFWVLNTQNASSCANSTFMDHQDPISNQTNVVCVQLKNRGNFAFNDLFFTSQIKVYKADASTGLSWVQNIFTEIGSGAIPPIAAGGTLTIGVPWIVSATDKGHFCLVVRIDSPVFDPMRFTETTVLYDNARQNNNIAWRNVNIADVVIGVQDSVDFNVALTKKHDANIDLVFENEQNLIGDGARAAVDLGPNLFARWQAAGGMGTNIEVLAGTRVRLRDFPSTIAGIPLLEGEPQAVSMTVELFQPVPYHEVSRSYQLEVVQIEDGERVGGVSYNVLARALDAGAEVHGQTWDDMNNNGTRDAGEPGLNGWTIQAVDSSGTVVQSTVTTDADLDGNGLIDPKSESGLYWFTALLAGTHTVQQVPQAGWMQTLPASPSNYTFTATVGQLVSEINFGNYDTGCRPSPGLPRHVIKHCAWSNYPKNFSLAVASGGDFSLAGGRVVLGFHVQAGTGSGLDPAAPLIRGSSGLITPLLVNADLANKRQSLVLADLPAGNYTVEIRGERRTTGAGSMDVFLVGDANGDRKVDITDGNLIRSIYGSLVGSAKYKVEADANLDGRITSFDYAQWRRNLGDSTTLEPLVLDAPAVVAGTSVAPPLTPALLDSLLATSISRWIDSGFDREMLKRLAEVKLLITDLPDSNLGWTINNQRQSAAPNSTEIWIDLDAAGYGWFVDPTPAKDEEFVGAAENVTHQASAGSSAAGRVDLLSVLMHELGHALGIEHSDADLRSDDVMVEALALGKRRLPSERAQGVGNVPVVQLKSSTDSFQFPYFVDEYFRSLSIRTTVERSVHYDDANVLRSGADHDTGIGQTDHHFLGGEFHAWPKQIALSRFGDVRVAAIDAALVDWNLSDSLVATKSWHYRNWELHVD